MYFDFETDLENLNYRSVFANRVLKLVYEKHQGNLELAVKEAEPIFKELKENVRNIYELVENEIPLFAYHNLLKNGADNYGFSQQEYEEKLAATIKACHYYYKDVN